MSVKFSRRELITHLKNILGTAGLYPLLPAALAAKDAKVNMNEHFFIFVELKGGVHHLITTDYPDPVKVKKIEENFNNVVMRFKIDPDKKGFMDHDEISKNFKNELQQVGKSIVQDGEENASGLGTRYWHAPNGYFVALPEGEYIHSGNNSKRLGYSGLPLSNYVDDLGVLRGVFMQSTFHGPANSEIYSGSKGGELGGHVAGVLAKLLVDNAKLPVRALDNLVLNGAKYTSSTSELPPLRLTLDILLALLNSADKGAGATLHDAEKFAQALLQDLHLGGEQGRERKVFTEYHAMFAKARAATDKLSALQIDKAEFDRDLYAQLKVCQNLFTTGLTRVATICLGNNGMFGMFDTHTGLFHRTEDYSDDTDENPNHYKKLENAMSSLAQFIQDLKDTPYGNKRLIDMVTIVVSSDFGRNANFAGSRIGTLDERSDYGNGHYYLNNNYIFCGKNVNSVWLGASDPITRYPYVADFERIQRGETSEDVFIDPVDPSSKKPQEGVGVKIKAGFKGQGEIFDQIRRDVDPPQKIGTNKRALMAKDVVKTIMAMAGFGEEDFRLSYGHDFYRDAQELTPLIKK